MKTVTHLPRPPKVGPPLSYIHVVWLDAPDDQPVEYFDELDIERWSIRCIRKYRNGSTVRFDYHSANWRDLMPDAAIDEPDKINRDSQFRARVISRDVFDDIWKMGVQSS